MAISRLADHIEREARRGRATTNTLHFVGEPSCIHLGAEICPQERAWILEPITRSGRLWPTPFGFCDTRAVAAELNLRKALGLERLTYARTKGYDVPYLHVWEAGRD